MNRRFDISSDLRFSISFDLRELASFVLSANSASEEGNLLASLALFLAFLNPALFLAFLSTPPSEP